MFRNVLDLTYDELMMLKYKLNLMDDDEEEKFGFDYDENVSKSLESKVCSVLSRFRASPKPKLEDIWSAVQSCGSNGAR